MDKNLEKVGKILQVLIDGKEGEFYLGRTESDSPEVDNEVLIPANKKELIPGEFYQVKVFDATEFDLYADPL